MNIAENLQLLQQTKEDIYQAINSKGVYLESGTPFSDYAQAILDLTGDTRPVLPEGVYEITVNCTGSTDGSESIGFYAALMTVLPFDPEGVRYQDRYINVWTAAPASTQNPDYQIMFNYDTKTGEVGINQNDAYTSSPIYLQYGFDVKQMTDPADTGNTIWVAYFSARQTGTFYVQSVDMTYPIVGVNTTVCEPDPCVEDPCSSPDCPDYDAEACGGGESIPEGLHKFTISQSQWPDYAMMVEAFYNPGELKKGETGSQTVNIYEDPNGEPLNTITYNGYVVGVTPEVYVQNTNANAGVYCSNSSDWSSYTTNPLAFKLECRTAGDYYIEVADHANPNFYDANGTQINPE